MRAATSASLAALIAAAAVACSEPAPPPELLIVRAGRLFDGTGAATRERVRLVIRAGTIAAVEDDLDPFEVPPGAQVLDARSLTVLPGLIDAHAHLGGYEPCDAGSGSQATGAGQTARNLHALLAAGVTTVADVGRPLAETLATRRFAGTGTSRGPRVWTTGPWLVAGNERSLPGRPRPPAGALRELSSPAAAQAEIQRWAGTGADVVAVRVGQVAGSDTAEVLCAVIEEAHRLELRVLAYAPGPSELLAAIQCSADAFVNVPAEPLDPEALAALRAAPRPLVPALTELGAPFAGAEPLAPGKPRGPTDEGLAASPGTARDNVATLVGAGIPLALGTGAASCSNPTPSPVHELRALVAAGLTPVQALRAATAGSAQVLDLQDALGTLAAGYRADLIAVAGKPDIDVDDLQAVRTIVIDGVVQSPDAPGNLQRLSLWALTLWTSVTAQ